MSKELRKERSVVVSARVDALLLADMAVYMMREMGIKPESMSSLVHSSLMICQRILKVNGLLSYEHKDLLQALDTLGGNGLLQRSAMKRVEAKINRSRGWENLRIEGDDPEWHDPSNYKMLHNRNDAGDRTLDEVEERFSVSPDMKQIKDMVRKHQQKQFDASKFKGKDYDEDGNPIIAQSCIESQEARKKIEEEEMEKERKKKEEQRNEEKEARDAAACRLKEQLDEANLITGKRGRPKKGQPANADEARPLTEDELAEREAKIKAEDDKVTDDANWEIR